MGVETAVAGAIAGGAALLGVNEQRKARKAGQRAANEQREFQSRQEAQLKKESDRLNSEIAKTQKRINAGQARANRSRIRGGIFGESEPTPRNMSATLG